jgi:serine/threonine protein kinase
MLLDEMGHIKICDFGFAASVGNKADGSADSLHDGCGTAMYIAPEIAQGFSKSSHGLGVDWWGLGVVLFEMIAGLLLPEDYCL